MAHYSHTRDIDLTDSIDAVKIDDQVRRVMNPLALAFERSGDLGASFRALMADMLRQFLGTHESIRLVMKNCETKPRRMADAMSLAREQIEKVYAVALLLEDPEPWTERYVKEAWRKSYERHLLDKDERSGLARYTQFLDDQADALEEERKMLGITEEKKVVEIRDHRSRPQGRRADDRELSHPCGRDTGGFGPPTRGSAPALVQGIRELLWLQPLRL